jgi:hypothetical protein
MGKAMPTCLPIGALPHLAPGSGDLCLPGLCVIAIPDDYTTGLQPTSWNHGLVTEILRFGLGGFTSRESAAANRGFACVAFKLVAEDATMTLL